MRLFVAVEIPELQKGLLQILCGGVPGARWTEPDSFHLTLRFIGEVDGGEAEEIDVALADIQADPFPVTLAGVGQFNTRGVPRTLWAGVEEATDLRRLARKADRAVVQAGLPAEERSFTPHVTLARLKDPPVPRVMRFLSENGLLRAPPFTVEHFTLFESRRGNDRAVYVPLAYYPLGRTASEGSDGEFSPP
jgi:2'-5' RNA ligase